MTVVHKTEPPWFDQVRDIPPGQKRRVGDGRLASFNGKAYMLYDFREKETEVFAPEMSLAQKVAVNQALREAQDRAQEALSLPDQGAAMPHVKDWPSAARAWLYKAGLNNDDISHLGAYWSPNMQRVVVPLRQVSGQAAWIARTVDLDRSVALGRTPKYLFPRGMARGGGTFFPAGEGRSSTLVITEDFLSAFRVSWSGRDALTVHGTSMDREAVLWVEAQGYTEVIMWLDGDKWGRMGARRIRDDLARIGVHVRNVTTPKDPKFYEPEEIEAWLK